MDPWERRPFPPLDLGAVDFDSIRWLVLDLFGPFLFLCVQVQRALGKQRLAHGACARGIPAAGRGAGGEQSAQAQARNSKSSGPGQKAAHGRTATAARQGGDLALGMAHGSREASTSRQALAGMRQLG